MYDDRLKDRVCVVTGASGGLGEEIARELGRLGGRLILAGRDGNRLQQVSGRFSEESEVIASFSAELASTDEVSSLVQRILRASPRVDVLVNCAGLFPVGPLGEMPVEQIEECLSVNLSSAILLCRGLTPSMVEGSWGRVVNIASSSAYAGFGNTTVYCASKHGLLGFSRALDEELKEFGVRSVCVSPGSIRTPMGKRVPGQDFSTFLDPVEVAKAVAWVVGLDNSMIVNELRLNRMEIR